MYDIRGSLRRQSLLVAVVCVGCDAVLFSVRGPLGNGHWQPWAVLIGGVAVNAALAGPARYSGWVSLAHALLFAASPLLISTTAGYVVGNNAGVLIAGYRAGAWLRPKPAVLALLAMVAGVTAGCVEGGGRTASDLRLMAVSVSVSALLPWLVGRYTTARRAYIADLEREADERRQHEEAAVRRAVTEERTTIARDLHDVISHHVSAIGVHAGAARLGLPEGDSPVRKSLGAVESASRSAMADLRRLLDLLHAETGAAQPGLDNLDELVETVRAAGLPTRLTLLGEPRELAGSLDVALYRIAQEGLTNALRHGVGPVEVELNHGRTEIVLTVTNGLRPGRTSRGDHAHRGLAGIRQRVTLFGGQVAYGENGTQWQLRTTFPVEST
ncbi:sensor histidine kinase [Amycolatopsis sp. WQ 127309]|uniref:sensor histidine kinase n=1 Tax=Amycolatopsis sp. WQ 127309 TaxID=2932773 RepID=UPI001FF20FDC|nr:histidine kinase [Amycolatopsis sp. WQ 127309]UOZ08547.1 histidine kinase [Amycolatopsis sp. WQ 127309]